MAKTTRALLNADEYEALIAHYKDCSDTLIGAVTEGKLMTDEDLDSFIEFRERRMYLEARLDALENPS